MGEQQVEQDQHVAEARVSPSPRTAGRYTKPKDRHTASKYRYSMSRDHLTRKCERCGYAEHLRGGSCPALGQRCNKCNAKGHFASVCRSKHNTVNFECHKAYESNVKGQNHIVAKPKVTEEDRLSVTSKVTEPNHRLKLVNRLRSSVWLTAQRRKTLGL